MTSEGILITAGTVVGMLVQGAFDGLAHLTGGRHLSAGALARAVAVIGAPLVLPPPELLPSLSAAPVPGEPPGRHDVVVPLWTASGPASLGVALRLAPTPWDTFDVEILGFPEVAAPRLPTPDTAPRLPAASPSAPPSTGTPVPERWRPALAAVVHRLVVGDDAGPVRDRIIEPPEPTAASAAGSARARSSTSRAT